MTELTDVLDPLSEREREIIPLIAEGLSNSEIANRLFLARSTVKWYVRQLNQKLDTSNREEIVERVEQLGLLALPDDEKTGYQRIKTNLPYQTTPFIGRDAELDEIHAILEKDDVRLLTILAPGGMGKTRLALEAAEQQSNHFPDGVYFVPLQPLVEAEQIVPQIANSLDVQFGSARTPKQQILSFLSDKRILLLFDNFEHLLEGVMVLNDILTAAPDVKILVTSREKTNLKSETVYVLPGMHFPAWETPEDALRYDAVQLLVNAAQRVKPAWEVTEANLDYVARACRLTQGMPLGILLATSWLDVYDLERICDEIQHSADILETEMRDVPERQRSIRAIFDHAWQRLTPAGQDALMKMSVFRGGCTPDAAEQITGANGRTLQRLMSKALIQRTNDGRYEMHELLRQYAEVYLRTSPHESETHDAHMRYYAQHLQNQKARLLSENQPDAIQIIERDFDNIYRAWEHILHHQHDELLDSLLFTLIIYSDSSGQFLEVSTLFEIALEALQSRAEPVSPLLRARLQTCLGSVSFFLGKRELSESLLEKALPVWKPDKPSVDYLYGLETLIFNKGTFGKKDERAMLRRQYIALAKACDDPMADISSYLQISTEYEEANNIQALLETGEQWLASAEMIGSPSALGWANQFVGSYQTTAGNLEQAITYKERAAIHFKKINHKFGLACVYGDLAGCYYFKGDIPRLVECCELSIVFFTESGTWSGSLGSHLVNRLFPLILQCKLDAAHHAIDRFAQQYPELDVEDTKKSLQSWIAELEGNYTLAFALFQASNEEWNLRHGMVLCCLERYADALLYLNKALETALRLPSISELLLVLAGYTLIIANESKTVRATHILSLLFQHPTQMACITQHPKLLEVQARLRAELGADYASAWEHGASLDLVTVAQALLDEYKA